MLLARRANTGQCRATSRLCVGSRAGLPVRCIREVAFTGQFAERARNPEAPSDMSSSATRPLTFAD